jgi:hypothetical protein
MINILTKLDNIEKIYICELTMSLKTLKKKIVNDMFTTCEKYSKFKYLDFNNISDKIYRNFGKVCLLNGPISNIFDNRLLEEFFNENQDIVLEIIPIEEEETPFNTLTIKSVQKKNSLGSLTNIINKDFVFRETDFPSLS